MNTRRIISTISIAGSIALGVSACGGQSGPCVVLANGGNTLCGGTAASWCRATDPLRQLAASNLTNSSNDLCQTIESQYPQ
jgi:hypothetical protein